LDLDGFAGKQFHFGAAVDDHAVFQAMEELTMWLLYQGEREGEGLSRQGLFSRSSV
jgi:hypothetical protein